MALPPVATNTPSMTAASAGWASSPTGRAASTASATAPNGGLAWRLLTIPCSHFCDKARWALEMAGHPYREDMYPPFIHLFGTLLAGLEKRSTPQLISPDGKQVISDSTDILRWAAKMYPHTPAGQLYPPKLEEEVAKWEKLFNTQLGPQARVIVYYHLFQDGPKVVAPLMCHQGMPTWRSWAYRAFYPLITFLMRIPMKLNASYTEVCTRKVRGIFAEVSAALSDGRPFLVPGSTAPTAADITFAALAAPLIAPVNVGGKLNIHVPTPSTDDWPGTELAVTRAGKHCHRMYELYRMPPCTGPSSAKGNLKGGMSLPSPLASPIGTAVANSPRACG